MVDANVLILAFRKIDAKDAEDVREWKQTSLDLLKKAKVVRACAIAWMEFVRGLREEDRERLSKIYAKIQPEVVDGRIMDRAIALMKARNLTEKICAQCKTSIAAHPCPTCKRIITTKQNMNDAIIVAAAELADDVDVLYGFDGGINHFSPFVDPNRCRIVRPPHHIGPLFDTQSKR